eukprot:1153760-Pelagomonas_calceolata.AAC.5
MKSGMEVVKARKPFVEILASMHKGIFLQCIQPFLKNVLKTALKFHCCDMASSKVAMKHRFAAILGAFFTADTG